MDTTFAALRVAAVAVTLMLAVLLSLDAFRAIRPTDNVQTVAMEMVAGGKVPQEEAGGGPAVLAEAPAEAMAALASEPVPAADVEQVELLAAADEAPVTTEAAAEGEVAAEALSMMAAPLPEGTPALEMSDSENLGLEGEIASEQGILAKQASVETEDEAAIREARENANESNARQELSVSRDALAETSGLADRETLWTSSRVAAAVLTTLLVFLLGALAWIRRRRVTL
ncbi:MAG: hypothetical protein R6X16_17515 [Anaerolineae bacterium]